MRAPQSWSAVEGLPGDIFLRLESGIDPTRPKPHSPATTTRSNRGFELSPRLRSSKMLIRKPLWRCTPYTQTEFEISILLLISQTESHLLRPFAPAPSSQRFLFYTNDRLVPLSSFRPHPTDLPAFFVACRYGTGSK